MRYIYFIVYLILFPPVCSGANLYMATTGTDSGDCTVSPCLTLQYSMGRMSSGDTLEIADGTYTGSNNIINATYHPPIGISTSSPTTIKAENNGMVQFDGENTTAMFTFSGTAGGYSWMQYWSFEGIEWVRSSGNAVELTNGTVADDFQTGDLLIAASYIKFKNCGFHGAGVSFNLSLSKQVLLEDCYSWGNGRYGINLYLDDDIVVRRHVDRRDVVTGASFPPTSSYITYASRRVEFQNCITLDVDSSLWDAVQDAYGGFYARNSYEGRHTNAYIRGSMVINWDSSSANSIRSGGIFLQSDPVDTLIENSIIVGSSSGVSVAISNAAYAVSVDHVTVINADHDSSYHSYGVGNASQVPGTINVTNSAFINNTFLDCLYYESSTSDYNNCYGNESDTMSYGSNNQTGDPGILYPVRIESGSANKSSASDGGDIGATILKRIGVDGSFYGESNYNVSTSTDLWPWSNETVVKTALSRDYGSSDETRGFCAVGQSLTRYIFGLLGNGYPLITQAGIKATGTAMSCGATGTPISILE